MSRAVRHLAIVHTDCRQVAERERQRDKKRRQRQREKDGIKEARVMYTDAESAFLADLGWLDPAKVDDCGAVGAAIGRLIADTAARHRNR